MDNEEKGNEETLKTITTVEDSGTVEEQEHNSQSSTDNSTVSEPEGVLKATTHMDALSESGHIDQEEVFLEDESKTAVHDDIDDPRSFGFQVLSDNIKKALMENEERKARKRTTGGKKFREKKSEEQSSGEWQEKVIQIRRVTKVVKGGKKLTFRAIVVVGNGKGKVGFGIGKSNEVIGAIQKAIIDARKNVIYVPIWKKTIPYPISAKAGSGKILIKPASEGTGIIAGGVARAMIELCGIENVLCKSLGANSPLNVARATMKALNDLKTFSQVAKARGLSLNQMLN